MRESLSPTAGCRGIKTGALPAYQGRHRVLLGKADPVVVHDDPSPPSWIRTGFRNAEVDDRVINAGCCYEECLSQLRVSLKGVCSPGSVPFSLTDTNASHKTHMALFGLNCQSVSVLCWQAGFGESAQNSVTAPQDVALIETDRGKPRLPVQLIIIFNLNGGTYKIQSMHAGLAVWHWERR